MIVRQTISHEIEGSLVISESEGWKDAISKMERHPVLKSLVEYYISSFSFYGSNGFQDGGLDRIKSIERVYGPDAILIMTIEENESGRPEDFKFVYSGNVNIITFIESITDISHDVKYSLTANSLWNKTMSRFDVPVDIRSSTDLDGGSCIPVESVDITLSPQRIRAVDNYKQLKAYDYGLQYDPSETSPDFMYEIKPNKFASIDLEDRILTEITTKFDIGATGLDERPSSLYYIEYDGSYSLDLKFNFCLKVNKYGVHGDTANGYLTLSNLLKVFIQINDSVPIEFTTVDVGTVGGGHTPGVTYSEYTEYTYINTLNLKKGDSVRIYAQDQGEGFGYGNDTFTIFFFQLVMLGIDNTGILWSGQTPSTDPPEGLDSHIYITADTIFPETVCPSFYTHDIFGGILDRIVGRRNVFESPYLGGTITKYKAYPDNGLASNYINARGLQIRGYTLVEKPFSQSAKDQWEGINPVLNIGMGYDKVNGSEKIVIRKVKDFYDDSDVSIYLSNVKNISRSYDENLFFNQIELGYSKWQAEEISGIDDPQSQRIFTTRFKNIGDKISILSNMIAASIPWEMTRRTGRLKSKDYKFDNDTFILAVVDLHAETDEVFSDITNLLNEDSRYNKRLTVYRNFLRWSNYFSGGLQAYPNSYFKFTKGVGNYDMTSTMVDNGEPECFNGNSLSEKQDISISSNYIHTGLIYTIDHYLTKDQYRAVQENRHKAIAVSQSKTDYVKFFTREMEYKRSDGSFKLIAWPKVFMDLNVVNNSINSASKIFVEPPFSNQFS